VKIGEVFHCEKICRALVVGDSPPSPRSSFIGSAPERGFNFLGGPMNFPFYWSRPQREREAARREWTRFGLIALGCLILFAVALSVVGF
jgi:hypothetical protein